MNSPLGVFVLITEIHKGKHAAQITDRHSRRLACQGLPHHCWPESTGHPEEYRQGVTLRATDAETRAPDSEVTCWCQSQGLPPGLRALSTPPAKETAEPTHPSQSARGQMLPQTQCLISTPLQNPVEGSLLQWILEDIPKAEKELRRACLEFGQRGSPSPPKNRHFYSSF